VAFLAFLGLHVVVPRGVAPLLTDLLGIAVVLAGFVLGIVALFGLKRHDQQGILRPALIGLVLNGLFLLIAYTNATAAAKRARERRLSPPPTSPGSTSAGGAKSAA
jgi:hypothetical protein